MHVYRVYRGSKTPPETNEKPCTECVHLHAITASGVDVYT